MVQGKKVIELSNGTTKYQSSNMSFPRKDMSGPKVEGRQNGNAGSFRTDSAISGARNQGERTLQRWTPDGPPEIDGSLESSRSKPNQPWDQFAENAKRFGTKTDYDENIYTTQIDTNHPQYRQRLAEADRLAREIERSTPTNSHIAEERVRDNVGTDGLDEEDKYSGVRRQQDFPPLTTSNNKYTPPARRAPTGQSTVAGAPVDPAIISSQLARPDKPTAEKTKTSPAVKPATVEISTPPTTTQSSFSGTPEPKAVATASPSASRTASPQVKGEGVPNATATVERDVTSAFKNFASQQRTNVEKARVNRIRNDKEIKLNDLKKFADTFKLNTPVPSDLVSIIAKDPAKQKEIQEKAKRNAEAAAANPSEGVKPISAPAEARSTQRTVPAAHGASSANMPNRQAPPRNNGFTNTAQFRGPAPTPQSSSGQQIRATGGLGSRLRSLEQTKQNQLPPHPIPSHDTRQPPTGPANNVDPNFSRRSSGVASAQGARLNPHSTEFRPSPHAASFNPTGNPSSGSSPRSAVNALPPTPISRSLLRRKPLPESERPSIKDKFNALNYIKTIKPAAEKTWKATGGIKPAYDTFPLWRRIDDNEKPDSTMHMTYVKLFEMAPFPTQPMSSPSASHAMPQNAHLHQLPFHLQPGMHNMGARQSPRQAPMSMHGNQHGHGPAPPFNGHDDHRMMPSHSAQSFASPRLQNAPIYPSPMAHSAQMQFNPQQMMAYSGAPPMQAQYRSMSQTHQFMPQQQQQLPIMIQNHGPTFLTSQGMAPGPSMMYGQAPGTFMPPGNGHPPQMPGVNGFPSPGRAAPMMMSQGSQQGHQQQPPIYGMTPGMSPGPHFVPMYPQNSQGQMPMRGNGGYGGPNQFGTSPQQVHQFGPQQHRNSNHPNGNYNNKNFQSHAPHQNGPPNNQVPTGPQARTSEGNEEAK